MELLTEKQQRILEFIELRLAENVPPSQKEIAAHFGLVQNAAFQLIGYLKKKGYLEQQNSFHRGLRLSSEYLAYKEQTRGLPLVGRVAAGEPILAEQNIETYIDIPELVKKQYRDAFLLKVVGDSMIEDGIMDGDYVIVRPQSTVENDQIAVVLLEDEATVKRVFFKSGQVILKPANPKYKSKSFKKGDKSVRIVGKVAGCFRML
ncbi:MAG: transcriptional repressor LexA [Planctomycetaceae bacterium]|nr:transcriptional repressor LexA [Planctomycetaceae bacterium]